MKRSLRYSLYTLMAALVADATAQATEFQPLAKAIKTILGTSKAFKKNFGPGQDIYYSKNAQGAAKTLAFIEKGLYEPNCTHTWVVGVDAATHKVTGIEVVEMKCPHAFPTRERTYLEQYIGKGPADAKALDKNIDTIAKATGSCNLTTAAVVRSIESAVKNKGSF